MKKIFILLIWSFVSGIYAQDLLNTGALIQGGVEDGNKLVEAYVKPLNKAIVFGLSDVTYTKIKKSKNTGCYCRLNWLMSVFRKKI